MSFSLTHPEPSKPAPPRGMFQPRNYAEDALTHWLDAQIISHDLDTAIADAETVGNRIVKGDLWLKERGPSNPDYERAKRQLRRLETRQAKLLFEVKGLYVRLYLACCAVYGSCALLDDPQAWVDEYAGGQWVHSNHRAVWNALQPDRRPPFTHYPPPDHAWHIDPFTTFGSLERWMQRNEELEARRR